MESVLDQQLELLRLLRDATQAGKITWRQSDTDADWFYSLSAPFDSLFIQFKWPEYIGNGGSDRDFVEVGGVGRFMVGTEGWAIALDILAAAFASWDEHVTKLRTDYYEKIHALREAIEGGR